MSLYRKLFTKITIYQKLNKILQFYKNWLVVSTFSFHIRSNIIFSKNSLPHVPLKTV